MMNENVDIKVDQKRTKATIGIDLTHEVGLSDSEKSITIAKCRETVKDAEGREVTIQVNCYRKNPDYKKRS